MNFVIDPYNETEVGSFFKHNHYPKTNVSLIIISVYQPKLVLYVKDNHVCMHTYIHIYAY